MKKLLLLSLLTFGFCTIQLHAMEELEHNLTVREEETKEQDSLTYTIVCKNGELEIDKSQFKKLQEISGTIAHLMQDINDTTMLEGNVIPLQQLESNVVQKILDLISTMPQEQKDDYTKFIEKLSQHPLDNLISFLNAANYLDIQPVLDLLSKAIAHKITQEINNISTGNFSQKTIHWLQQNRNELNNLPNEFLNLIAIQIVEQNPFIKHIRFATQVLTGHTNSIWCLAFSPDGNTIASGSWDNTIRIWTKDSDHTFSLNNTLTGHTNWIRCLAFSPDGNTIASGSDDNTIRIWTKDSDNTFSLNNTLTGHTNWIWCLAFSPDGNTIASGSWDNTIRIWTKDSDNTFSLNNTLTGHTKMINCLAFSSDGNTIASGSDDNTIRIWTKDSDNTFSLNNTLTGHTKMIRCLAFSPDGNTIASGSDDNTIRIWTKDSDNNFSLNNILIGHIKMINCLAFSPDGNTIASGSRNKTIRIWEKNSDNNFSLNNILIGHIKMINCLAFSPDGNTIASGSDDRTIRIWEKLPYQKFILEQALMLLMWQQSKLDNVPFEVPQEESLRNVFEAFPDNLKNFLTNKEQ